MRAPTRIESDMNVGLTKPRVLRRESPDHFQLRTYRCTALTDGMCQYRKVPVTNSLRRDQFYWFRIDKGSGRHESARPDHVGMPAETKFKGRLFRR